MSRRGTIAVGILALWLVGLAALARRELFRPMAERLAMAATRVAPGGTYFAVHQEGEQIGFASTTIDTTEASIVISDYFVAELPVGGRYQRATATTRITLSRSLGLRDFSFRLEADGGPVETTGIVTNDSTLVIATTVTGAAPDTQRLTVSGPVLLPTLVPLVAALTERPAVGTRYTFPVFDPLAMRVTDVRMIVRAESLFVVADSARLNARTERWMTALQDTVRAWELVPDTAASPGSNPAMYLAWWVDELGRVVEARQAAGMRLERTAYELAFENWRLDAGARPRRAAVERDILESTAIAAAVPVSGERPSRLRVRLRGVALAGFDLEGGRQRLDGDVLTVAREDTGSLRAGWTLPADSTRFGAELRPDLLIQSDHRSIRRLARDLRGKSTDPRLVAERINTWVHRNVRKRVTMGVPSALEVLESRSGDCNEHTQLFIALARAAGIPARGAAGLAWVDGKFYYHAWPEVYLGAWVAVDPTFGQFPADAAHLRFTSGGVTRQVELLRLIGNLDIDVLDASVRPEGAAR